jgi:transketolase
MVAKILSAEEQLAKEKISASALNISTLKPLDTATILHVARSTGAIVTVEEHSIYGGLGGAVAEIVCEHYPVPVKRVGVKDRMGQSGTYPELIKEYGLDVPDIIDAVHEVLSKR